MDELQQYNELILLNNIYLMIDKIEKNKNLLSLLSIKFDEKAD